jgi:two-component system chemotaxis response regulator CheB
MIRVMVVDDSVVVRQIVSDALGADPEIKVVAVAHNGKVALEKLAAAQPDVVTLDLEMPEMDGLTALTEIRKLYPQLPVLVFSTLTERGAGATLDALSRGASDYVCKPSGQRNVQATIEKIRSELIPKIRALHERKLARAGRPAPRAPGPTPASPTPQVSHATPTTPISLVVIAVSTGGPAALAELIPQLPRELRQPILIVQHMPPVFTRILAQRLAASSALAVREAVHREHLQPGCILLAPGDHHMRVAGNPRDPFVTLDQEPAENGCRPAADPLFGSAAHVFGSSVLAIVMTGLGHDGTAGAAQVRKASGQVWIQDEASSTVWSMPGSVMEAGLAQRAVPLSKLARAIGEVCQAGAGVFDSAPRVHKKAL